MKIFALIAAGATLASAAVAPTCNADNCARAVTGRATIGPRDATTVIVKAVSSTYQSSSDGAGKSILDKKTSIIQVLHKLLT